MSKTTPEVKATLAEFSQNVMRFPPIIERHGTTVLDADTCFPSPRQNRFFNGIAKGEVTLDHLGEAAERKVDEAEYKVTGDLREHVLLVKYRVNHQVRGLPGEFDGWYVASDGDFYYPLLLAGPHQITKVSPEALTTAEDETSGTHDDAWAEITETEDRSHIWFG